jgi:hypothetical protein
MKAIIEFLANADLWVNVVGGIVAAILLGIIALVWRQYAECRVRQLGDLMGRIIEYRNRGLRPVADPTAWVQKAR